MGLRFTAKQAAEVAVKTGQMLPDLSASKQRRLAAPLSKGEESLALAIRATQLPVPEREFPFHAVRDWRFDFAWPDVKVAAEVEGGTRSGNSRHTRHDGFERDIDKYNTATLEGWRVLRFTTQMVNDGRAIAMLERAFEPQQETEHT